MHKPSPMPTWQIFPDTGNTYRWIISDQNTTNSNLQPQASQKTLIHHNTNPTSHLPSMEDLLIQGSSKLFQNCGGSYDEQAPMFRTGSGKSVEVKRSSVAKAMSVLKDIDAVDSGADSPSMFRMASGKSFEVKESSVKKALAVLGEDDCGDAGFSKVSDRNVENSSLFCTGSGKSVEVKQSSVMKALSVLGEDGIIDKESTKYLKNSTGVNSFKSPMFKTGLGNSVVVKQSSVMKSLTILGEDDKRHTGPASAPHSTCYAVEEEKAVKTPDLCTLDSLISTNDGGTFSKSLFQTGSGRTVHFSSSGLTRAKALLCFEETSNDFSAEESNNWENSPNLEERGRPGVNRTMNHRPISRHSVDGLADLYSRGCETKELFPDLLSPEKLKSTGKPPPVKFQTAGGRSVSVSNDAFERAMSLLGDSEYGQLQKKDAADGSVISFIKESEFDGTSLNKEDNLFAYSLQHVPAKRGSTSRGFLPPKAPIFKENQGHMTVGTSGGNYLFGNKSSHEELYKPEFNLVCRIDSLNSKTLNTATHVKSSLAKNTAPKTNPPTRSSSGPLVDITNNNGTVCGAKGQISSEKRRLGKKSSVSPFKKPRISRFNTPLTGNICSVPNGSSTVTSNESCFKTKIFPRYPYQIARPTVKDFFGGPPSHTSKSVPSEVKCMNVERAEAYMFHDASHSDGIGSEGFCNMLVQSGASMQYATRDWVANHYKWIVWKLACYERGYPAKTTGKYLTVSNVLEELKYRYEREVNSAHRSALKRILEGDASPASMVVLCITAIHFKPDKRLDQDCGIIPYDDTSKFNGSKMAESSSVAKIELTDGWYAVDAMLDAPLLKQLLAGKLFVGQKLRIWRARLTGWAGPISPLELSKTVALQLHINGTYRAHWAEKLGFCRGPGAPLSFDCIKSGGGLVPKTVVGVTRIYPILYKERLADGGSVVRSERMESKMQQAYNQKPTYDYTESLFLNLRWAYIKQHIQAFRTLFSGIKDSAAQLHGSSGPVVSAKAWPGVGKIYAVLLPLLERLFLRLGHEAKLPPVVESNDAWEHKLTVGLRATIAEGITSEFQKDVSSFHFKKENGSEEGAKLLKILEKSAEPEIIMAAMSMEQLSSFAKYREKQEASRQSDIERIIENALEDAGLSERIVTPFMRMRVVGLSSNGSPSKGCCREGLITIWNPTEKQKLELVEGQVYIVGGLTPMDSESKTVFLQARGSSTTWQTLAPLAIASFKPFFTPRKAVFLSNMADIPLASEFDVAAVVVHVGEVYLSGNQKKQWVFVTDGSISVSELDPEKYSNCLLAISFCTPILDNDSCAVLSSTLSGSTIGFCNLVKRARDLVNHIWVAEATDNSTYSLNYDVPSYSHLKEAAGSANKWARISSSTMQKLKEKTLFMVT